jgi:hypothetical protein
MDVIVHRAAHTHGPPTYAPPRLPASSSSPTELSVRSTSRSKDTSGAVVPVAAADIGSSSRDWPVATASDSAGAEVDHHATGGGSSSPGVPRTRGGGARGRTAGGRFGRRGSCRRISSDSMMMWLWQKCLRWSVMRDIIVTVRLWGATISIMDRQR